MNYNKIYQEEYDSFSLKLNRYFIDQLKVIKDDYRELTSIEKERIRDDFRGLAEEENDKLEESAIIKDSYLEFSYGFDAYKNIPKGKHKVDIVFEKRIIPFLKEHPSINIELIIKYSASRQSAWNCSNNAIGRTSIIDTLFKQNQIERINITDNYKERKTKISGASILISTGLELEERLFIYFYMQKISSTKFNETNIKDFKSFFNSKETEYARMVALSIGHTDNELFGGNHTKSDLYNYINQNKYKDQTIDKLFLVNLNNKIGNYRIPRNVLEQLSTLISSAGKSI